MGRTWIGAIVSVVVAGCGGGPGASVPVVDDLAFSVPEDSDGADALTGTDADDDPLTFVVLDGPDHGAFTLDSETGDFTYTPDPDFNGSDGFTFAATDGAHLSEPGEGTITVLPVNDAPTAQDRSATAVAGQALAITLAGSDVDGDSLTFATMDPGHGTVTVDGDVATYTSDAGYDGDDAFTYVADDGDAESAAATVSIEVFAVDTPPTASDGVLTVQEDSGATESTLQGSDPDGTALVFAVVAEPLHGTAEITDAATGAWTYTPDADHFGEDDLLFTVESGGKTSAPARVDITVNGVNDAPVPIGDTWTTYEDTPVSAALMATDADGDNVAFEVITQPSDGSASTVIDVVTYTPNANFHGTDSFPFMAGDGKVLSGQATITIVVNPVNDAPVAAHQGYTIDEDDPPIADTLEGFDVEGAELTFALAFQAVRGTAVVESDGDFTYTPDAHANGQDRFTFTVSDGELTSAPANITITINPINDAPVAQDDDWITDEDVPIIGPLRGTDVEGSALAFALVDLPDNGTAVLLGDAVRYTPDPDFDGEDSFTFTADDGDETSAAATITITVDPVDDLPTALPASFVMDEDGDPFMGTLEGTDPEGDTLTFAKATDPAAGSVVIDSDGSFVYTPTGNAFGLDTFTFTVSDAGGASGPATVFAHVQAIQDAPIVPGGELFVDEDDPPTGDTLPASDPDGDALTFAIVLGPVHGTLVLLDENTGAITYEPFDNFNGTDFFTYEVSDGQVTAGPEVYEITVAPVNDVPEPVDDDVGTPFETPVNIDVLDNDDDIDGDTLSVSAVTDPPNGTATIEADDTVTYTPDAGYEGADSFQYTAHDGTVGVQATVNVTVAPGPELCVTTTDPFMSFTGLDAWGMGASAWNVSGSGHAEEAKQGHLMGHVVPEFSAVPAYYYLASRDYVEPFGLGAALADTNTLSGMPATTAALAANGHQAGQLGFEFGLLSLGDDLENTDWFWDDPVETRLYHGSTTFYFTLDLYPMVSAPLDLVTVIIDFGDTPLDPSTHMIAAEVGPMTTFQDASSGSPASVQAVAAAFLSDLQYVDALVVSMDTLQPATQADFGSEGRNGAHYDIVGAPADPICAP